MSLLLRFLLGGVMVSVFAAVGSCFQPKTFAGLFGSAPPIALVSLGIAFYGKGAGQVETLSRSMALGAIALFVYSACCLALIGVRRLPVWLGAALAWLGWGSVAALLLLVLRGV
jgi:uncharacterized membrane protein (GlpM family)